MGKQTALKTESLTSIFPNKVLNIRKATENTHN